MPPRSMKSGELLRILRRLGYTEVRRRGSHRTLAAKGRPTILFAYHDGVTVGPARVRQMLMGDAGLTEQEVNEVL